MQYPEYAARLRECSIRFETEAPLARCSTFRIGGPADYLVFPADAGELCRAAAEADACGVPYLIVGNGSNLLFSDRGFRGAVILTGGLSGFRREGNMLVASAGMSLTALSRIAAEAGLAGLEFACGIPGTVGGAVVMNAGAYGGQISDVLQRSSYWKHGLAGPEDRDGEAHGFGYRHSVYLDRADEIVLSASMVLTPDDPEAVRARCLEHLRARQEKQPLQYPSAGSVFKRPEGDFAGRLIEAAGLKGCRVGDAAVSEKHAGFIVNLGNATGDEVRSLIELVRTRVFDSSGVLLECEVRMVPECPESVGP